HLLAQGYRQIGFLGARLDPRSMRRLQGYRQAMEAAGLLDDDLIVTTSEPSSASVGSTLCAGLLTRRSDVDALFCNNDDVALGALFEAQRRGLIIPDQLGICGFNDLDIMANAHPTLTSVRTPRAQMGRDALTMVIEAIEGRRPEKAQRDLGHMVMTRQSTCRSKCP
ncbi:MAG: substrate-binding domain-containing protein, partial [Rhodospirillaceae bacterium]